ncbi:hypothetical protein ACLB2K_021516 [Fragaria x ananassa]
MSSAGAIHNLQFVFGVISCNTNLKMAEAQPESKGLDDDSSENYRGGLMAMVLEKDASLSVKPIHCGLSFLVNGTTVRQILLSYAARTEYFRIYSEILTVNPLVLDGYYLTVNNMEVPVQAHIYHHGHEALYWVQFTVTPYNYNNHFIDVHACTRVFLDTPVTVIVSEKSSYTLRDWLVANPNQIVMVIAAPEYPTTTKISAAITVTIWLGFATNHLLRV